MSNRVHVIDHPLVQHKLSLMRMKSTSTSAFRNLLAEVSGLLAYEVTRDLPTHQVVIDTPLTRTSVPMLDGKTSTTSPSSTCWTAAPVWRSATTSLSSARLV